MKTTEIVGFKREEVGTKYSKLLRADGNVPCVLYGGKENIHFHSPAYIFKDLLYTGDAHIVHLNVEGVEKKCVLKDVQFHPVSDMLLHVDLLEIFDDKEVVVEVPVRLEGVSPGILKGGQVYLKSKKLKVKAIPANLPDFVGIDISSLELGKSIKVKEVKTKDFSIVTPEQVSIVSIIIPRALRSSLTAIVEGEEEVAAEEEA